MAPECLSQRTVKHCRDVLRAALNVAMKWNLVSRNAAALAAVTNPRKAKPHFYDESQAIFLEAISGDRLETLFWLALCLGPREGELLGLQWTDFDFEKETVTIQRSLQRILREGEKKSHLELVQTKTQDSDRSIWVPKLVLERVLAHRSRQDDERALAGKAWRETGMVFTAHKGTLLEPRNMLREYYRLRDRAQLPKIRFHDLRHSAATIMKMAGIPDEVIQKLLGHASVRTTLEIYMHLTTGAEKHAANKMLPNSSPTVPRPVSAHFDAVTSRGRPSKLAHDELADSVTGTQAYSVQSIGLAGDSAAANAISLAPATVCAPANAVDESGS